MNHIKTLCWWLFIYHQWPLRFIERSALDCLQIGNDIGLVLWHLCRIPFQPVAMIVAYCMDVDIREKLSSARERNVKRQDLIELRGTISFR